MDLSLNISGAGPLSQIGLHILNFDTAVHLASGAVGWWKSRNRSMSLIESISASKASIVCASNFNTVSYRERRRQVGLVRGLAVQQDDLCAIPGSIEQTAVSNDSGIDCMRAMTTGLLCFYHVQKVTAILAEIIPFGMLHPDHDDEVPVFEGPLLSSLRDWVISVAAEEDCNTYRNHLLQLVSSAQDALIGAEVVHAEHFNNSTDDSNHILGVLRWMVTPLHKRNETRYPTRSFHVWRIAVVMSELGFDISASLELIFSSFQYKHFLSDTENSSRYSDVALVTTSVGETDPWMFQRVHTDFLRLRPQVVSIRSIPHILFSRIAMNDADVTPEELVEMWNISFDFAKKAVGVPSLKRGGNVELPVARDLELVRENHKHLIGIWSTHMSRILRPAMELYIPASFGDPSWSHTELLAYFQRQRNGDPAASEDREVRRNVHKLSAILLGSIYGACVQSLIPMRDADGEASPSDSLQLAFTPENIISDKLFQWTASLGLALSGLLESSRWTGLLLELATGIEHTQPLNEQPSAGLLGRRLNITPSHDGIFQESHLRVSDIFGVQANGVFAVSDFVVRPSTNADSALKFHVGIGRILNLPIDGSGYLRTSQINPAGMELPLNPSPQLEILSRQCGAASIQDAFRIDAEPDWNVNAQTICFGVRRAGILISILNISQVLERLYNRTVSCTCGEPQMAVTVPLSERWQEVTVYQFLRPSYPGGSKLAAYIRDEDKIIVNVEGDDMKRIFIVGTLQCRKFAVCKDCIHCAYNSIRNKDKKESAALIVG
ncbi:hypothetical protein BGW36DRAFT_444432 [Talaromyces proteolyticus]|uniref:Uncharacterized protein n=1 Tax=Talaromyces proteolyticus TaxID=1131652 RepID=A0AAD4L3E2_9EURO|nr:uncharacterized protein BGW36DRAFT_444432 [Talaromyces proteolyticus]KAH8703884.1 hypothetical protein BGW36DRAFT_444432 [Talaromyces proteolyticus]